LDAAWKRRGNEEVSIPYIMWIIPHP